LNAVAYGLSCLELDSVDSAFRSCLSVQNSLISYPILKYGSESQRTEYIHSLTTGAIIGAFGLTEADQGSDPSNMSITAHQSGGDWIISGSKMWITNATIADLFIIWAQTEDGIKEFLVPRDTNGLGTYEILGKLSMRASNTGEILLDHVRVPKSHLLPEVGGIKGPLSCLTDARYGIIFGVIGSAQDSFNTAREYSIVREQFGRPIASFQLTQEKLAEMPTELIKMTLLANHVGRVKQKGKMAPELISYEKFGNLRSALIICRVARTILGAAGITKDYSP
jgi:glutaryl-CoA dehydrogenase